MTLNFPAFPDFPDLNSPDTYNARVLAWFVWCSQTMPNYLAGLNAEDFFPVQIAPTDATAGKVLLNGGHGLGASIIEFTGDIDDPSLMPSGLYRVTGAATGTKPAGVAAFDMIQLRRGTSAPYGNTAQLVVSEGGIYTRNISTGGGWTPWVRAYDWSNIVGTVSQSGGVPTGAIFESDSYANGEYVRYADGTQICTHRITGSASSGVTWTFPAIFSSFADAVVGTKIGAPGYVHMSGSGSSTSISVNVRDQNNLLVADDAFLVAYGRWV